MTQQLQKSIDFRRIELYDFHLSGTRLALMQEYWCQTDLFNHRWKCLCRTNFFSGIPAFRHLLLREYTFPPPGSVVYQHDWLYLQSINSDNTCHKAPLQFTFLWRHFALVSVLLISLCVCLSDMVSLSNQKSHLFQEILKLSVLTTTRETIHICYCSMLTAQSKEPALHNQPLTILV